MTEKKEPNHTRNCNRAMSLVIDRSFTIVWADARALDYWRGYRRQTLQ